MFPRYFLWVTGVFLIFPSVAYANAIIPYLMVPFAQLFLFPIVVAIETGIINYRLKYGFWKALWRVAIANLASTAVGAGLYFGGMPIVGDTFWNLWMRYKTPGAIVLSLFFASVLFILSWSVESITAKPLFKEHSKPAISKAFLFANIATYIALWCLSIIEA